MNNNRIINPNNNIVRDYKSRTTEDIMGGNGQPPCGGPAGNRCGHNVTDNDEFIKKGE